jgi:prepilin peptidase CpaA
MTLALATVLAASLVGAVCDVRTRRVPNALVGALFACGLIENAALFGWRGAAIDLALTVAVLLAGTVAFSFKLIGGGDVKLLAAAAGTLGYPAALSFVLLTLLCGGVIGLAYATVRGRLQATYANMQAVTLPLLAGVAPARPPNGLAMPYAVSIFAGALCTAALGASHLRLLP